MSKKYLTIIIVVLIIALPIAWYLLSPLWRVRVVNDASPIVNNLPSETETTSPPEAIGTPSAPAAVVPAPTQRPSATAARVIARGEFVPSAHDVAGTALLIENQGNKIVRFENFDTTDGPDVRVFLSADYDKNDAIEIGPLKATSGNVNYDVPAGVDTTKYNKILIWCKPFRVLFSSAELK